MKAGTSLESMREFLDTTEMSPDDRDKLENLLQQAEEGDEVALERIRQLTLERGGYQSMPGEDYPLAPGPLMVCPVDPAHFRTYQREVGETCPEHDVELVPAKEK